MMPTAKMPMASSDVPMGRRMNGPEIFMARGGLSGAWESGASEP
jgi:hypothetical protein